MSSTLKLSGALKLGNLASAPSNPEVGTKYYDTTLNVYRQWDGASWQETADLGKMASTSNGEGASLVGVEATPTNYAAGTSDVEAHLAGIDTALSTAGGTEFDDATFKIKDVDGDGLGATFDVSAVTTADKVITMPDSAVDLGEIATNTLKDTNVTTDLSYTAATGVIASSDGTDATITLADSTNRGLLSNTDFTKLGGIEALADVTDSTNVDAAGAVMESDSTTASMSFVIDEDSMASDLATKVPTQQSVKAYVDAEVASAVAGGATFQGDYDAATNSPDLDTTPIAGITKGDMYVATTAGTFFSSTTLEIGDVLIAKQDTPTLETHWTVVEHNLTGALSNVVEDATPQLGGDLDTNGNNIVTADATSAASDSLIIETGETVTSGDSGDLTLRTGIAATSRGDIKLARGTTEQLRFDKSTFGIDGGIYSVPTAHKDGASAGSILTQYDSTAGEAIITGLSLPASHSVNFHGNDVANQDNSGGTFFEGDVITVDDAGNYSGSLTTFGGAFANDSSSSGTFQSGDVSLSSADSYRSAAQNVASGSIDITTGASQGTGARGTISLNAPVAKRSQDSANFIEEEYINSITLTGGTAVATAMSELTFAHASFEGCEIVYKLKEATGEVRIGTMRIVTNGTTVAINDMSTETADLGVSFSAAVNGANIEVKYTADGVATTNDVIMRADVKRIKA